jgi:DNA-binding XRE family transcriptional regulator
VPFGGTQPGFCGILNPENGGGHMTFGEKLQKLRRTAGMSQEQLAEQLEVSRQAVSKWELGVSRT